MLTVQVQGLDDMIRDGRAHQWVEAIFHRRWEASASTPAQEPA